MNKGLTQQQIMMKYADIKNRLMNRDNVSVREFLDLHGFIGTTMEEMETSGIKTPDMIKRTHEALERSMMDIIATEFLSAFVDQYDDIMNPDNDVPVLMIQMNKNVCVLENHFDNE